MRTWRTQGKRPGRLAQPSPECAPRRATKRHAQPHCIAPRRLVSLDRSVSPVTNVASAWPMTPRCRTHPRQWQARRADRQSAVLAWGMNAALAHGSNRSTQGRFERSAWLWQRKENETALTYLNTLYTDARPVGAADGRDPENGGSTRSWSMDACVDAEGRWLALRAPGRRRARARRAARGQAGSSSELEQPALAPSRARRLTCGASYGPPGRASRSGASRSSGRSARSRTR